MGNAGRPLTESELEARRRNAQKSTGPRTVRGKQRVALNALKNGLFAAPQTTEQAMVMLGEDPAEFHRFRDSLIEARQPADAVERMLIEEIAALAWKKRRLDRAQEGLQVRSLELLELQRHRQALEVGRESADISQAEVLESGLRRAPKSPARFGEILSNLETLTTLAEHKAFAEEIDSVITLLYGETPTLRGAQIAGLWRQLREEGTQGAEARNRLAGLKVALAEEARDVVEEYTLFLQEQVHISPALRSSALAPSHPQWTVMIRQEYTLDRLIERKLKLLQQIQNDRQLRELAAREIENKPRWDEKKAILKNQSGEVIEKTGSVRKTKRKQTQNKATELVENKRSAKKQTGNKPENKAGQMTAKEGSRKNKPGKSPADAQDFSPLFDPCDAPSTRVQSPRPMAGEGRPHSSG